MSSLPPVTTAGMAERRPRERREWAAEVRSWGPKREFWREVGREARVEWRMSRVKERKRKEMGKWTVAGWIGLPIVFLVFLEGGEVSWLVDVVVVRVVVVRVWYGCVEEEEEEEGTK